MEPAEGHSEHLYEVQIKVFGAWETWRVFSSLNDAEEGLAVEARTRSNRVFRIKKTETTVTYSRETETSPGPPTFSDIAEMVEALLRDWGVPYAPTVANEVADALLTNGALPQFDSAGDPVKDSDEPEETATKAVDPLIHHAQDEEVSYQIFDPDMGRYGGDFCSRGEALDWIVGAGSETIPKMTDLYITEAATTYTVVDKIVMGPRQ